LTAKPTTSRAIGFDATNDDESDLSRRQSSKRISAPSWDAQRDLALERRETAAHLQVVCDHCGTSSRPLNLAANGTRDRHGMRTPW